MSDVLILKSKLTSPQLVALTSEMEKKKKSTGLAYVLWLFFGSLGIHKFYMGKIGGGFTYLILGILGWSLGVGGFIAGMADESAASAGTTAAVIGIIALIIVGILILIDLFTIPRQLRKRYENLNLNALTHFLQWEPLQLLNRL